MPILFPQYTKLLTAKTGLGKWLLELGWRWQKPVRWRPYSPEKELWPRGWRWKSSLWLSLFWNLVEGYYLASGPRPLSLRVGGCPRWARNNQGEYCFSLALNFHWNNKQSRIFCQYADVDHSSLELYDYVLSKAKTFGVHTDMYRISNVQDAKAGCAYTFEWLRD